MSICSICEGTGVESTYNGVVVHPYGTLQVVNEKHWPCRDLPGGTFYGGSGHKRCACLGPVVPAAPAST